MKKNTKKVSEDVVTDEQIIGKMTGSKTIEQWNDNREWAKEQRSNVTVKILSSFLSGG